MLKKWYTLLDSVVRIIVSSLGRVFDRSQVRDFQWREAKPIAPGTPRERYPAKEHCSCCGLCDTYYVAHVKDACAFLGDGMSRIEAMEPQVHGRARNLTSMDDLHFGVTEEMFYATNTKPSAGVQPAQVRFDCFNVRD